MKTIELNIDLRESKIDTTKYMGAGIKYFSKENIILQIAKKLKKPISEIQKKEELINTIYEKKFDLFLEKTIVGHISTAIKKIIVNGDINPFVNEKAGAYVQHQTPIKRKYGSKSKTFEIELRSNQQILAHKKLWKMRYYEHRTTNLDFMDDKVIPTSVKYWCTPIGKKEIQLIEDSLVALGKIKIEITKKSSKYNLAERTVPNENIYYIKYKNQK
jgi:hypothetical protein